MGKEKAVNKKKEETAAVPKKQLNMEILRILAMCMIITLHYLDKGGVLKEFASNNTPVGNAAWIIEAFCMVSVNIYVLISGYFLCESTFKIRKTVLLWIQILMYSWIITLIFAIILKGQFNFEEGMLYGLIPLLMPVTGSHYWFATVYILMYLVSPFLNIGIKAMDKKTHRNLIIILVAIFSIWNTVLPFTIPATDRKGMDICWFICLYVIAAYLRKYGDEIKINKWLGLAIYALCCIGAFLLGKGMLLADSVTGKLGGYCKNFYEYNSITILIASVALFIFFVKTEIKAGDFATQMVLFVSEGTFGVYLLHEHKLLRYLWPTWFNVSEYADRFAFIPHLLMTVACVFTAGVVIDFIRRIIVGAIDTYIFKKE